MIHLSDLSPAGGIGTAAQIVYSATYMTQNKATYLQIWNVAANGGGTIWLSYTGVAAPNAPGSFPLYPGQSQIFSDNAPSNGLSAVASVAGTPLTVMVG